jgi:hypothetical protein
MSTPMTEPEPRAANVVPGSITQVGVTIRYTLLDYLRSHRFVILLAITLFIAATLTAVIGYNRPPGYVSTNIGSTRAGGE